MQRSTRWNVRRLRAAAGLAALSLVLCAGRAGADEATTPPPGEPDAGKTNALFELLDDSDLSVEYRTYRGDLPGSSDQGGVQLHYEPRFALAIPGGGSLVFRADVPILFDQPYWSVDPSNPIFRRGRDYSEFLLRQSPQITAETGAFLSGHDHASDLGLALAWAKAGENGLVVALGVVGVLPSSEDDSNMRDQGLLGPELLLGRAGPNGYLGARLTHVVDVQGDDSFHTQETNIQFVASLDLGRGWKAISNPTVTYDWEGDSGNRLLLPIGGGISKGLPLGQATVEIRFEAYGFLVTSERFGADRSYRFGIALR